MDNTENTLTGHLLVAMPGMTDPRFAKSVVYLCSHEAEGAMGFVVNRVLESFPFAELLTQLSIPVPAINEGIQVHFGGPVESGRGFVLHSADYLQDSTLVIDSDIALTATVDIVRAIAEGRGPHQHFLALGYAGWAPGQLDGEIRENGWLTVEADPDLLFDLDQENKWDRAMAKLGVDASLLSIEAGNA